MESGYRQAQPKLETWEFQYIFYNGVKNEKKESGKPKCHPPAKVFMDRNKGKANGCPCHQEHIIVFQDTFYVFFILCEIDKTFTGL